jgi:malonyl CoA-acyl carrier protein transacylase
MLSAVHRTDLSDDLHDAFDRALFGLSVTQIRHLSNESLHLLEVVWEALERSGLDLGSLGTQTVGLFCEEALDGEALGDVFGLAGVVTPFVGAVGSLRSFVRARAALLAGDTDAAIVCGRAGEGVAAVVLGRDLAARRGLVGWLEGTCAERAPSFEHLDVVLERAAARSGRVSVPTVASEGIDGLLLGLSGTEPVAVCAHGHGLAVAVVVVPASMEPAEGTPPRLMMLSGRTPRSLKALVSATVGRLQTDDDVRSVAVDALRRVPMEHRLSLPTGPADTVRARLEAWLAGDGPEGLAVGEAMERGAGFVFAPSGSQYAHMAASLYDQEPAFRAAVMRCERGLRRRLRRPLLSVLFPQAGREVPMEDPLFASPLTFVIGYALSELLRAWGVEPEVALGCGVGEINAAVAAGALSVDDGLLLATERGRLLRTIEHRGARAVLHATEREVQGTLEAFQLRDVDIVACPVPHRTVVGGSEAAIDDLLSRLDADAVGFERLPGHPAHSRLVEPVLDDMAAVAARVTTRAPVGMRWVSTITGQTVSTAVGPEHWVASLRRPMRFSTAAAEAFFGGCRTFVELSPRPVMLRAGQRTTAAMPAVWVSSLQGPESGVDDRESLLRAVSAIWVRGACRVADDAVRGAGAALPPTPLDRRPLDEVPLEGHGDTLLPEPELGEEGLDPDENTIVNFGDETDDDDGADDDVVTSFFRTDTIMPPALPDEVDEELDDEGPEPNTLATERFDIEELRQAAEAAARAEEEAEAEGASAEVDDEPLLDDGPLHEVWVPEPLAPADTDPCTWIVLADEEGLGDYLLTLLTNAGHEGVRVLESQPYPRGDETLFVPDPAAEGAWDHVLDFLGTVQNPLRVLHLWALDSEAHTEPWLALLRLLATFRFRGLNVPTYVVTRGLFGDEPSVPAALLWGAGRQLQVESPAQWGGAIDLDEDEDAEALLAHLLERAAPTEVAFRGGERLARRLRPEPGFGEEPTLDMQGVWVLVGPIDPTLLTLAKRLVEKGASQLLLVSSETPTGKVMMEVLGLQRQGVKVTMLKADLREPTERAHVKQRIASHGSASGVVFRLALSEGPVLGAPEAVGRDEVTILEPLADLLPLAPHRMVWMPTEGLDPSEGSGWTAVVGPAVVQVARSFDASVVAGPFDGDDAVDGFLAGLRPGRVVVLP